MMKCLAMFLLAMVPVLAYTPDKDPASSQISPSILLMNEVDWTLSYAADGTPKSRCLDMVARAREFSSGNRLNFVPTFHWLPGNNGFGVYSFCFLGLDGSCVPWNPAKVAEFKESMTLCFMEAFNKDFVVYLRPNLQDGLNKDISPSGLLFSPLLSYEGYSYADIVTTPLAEAMRDAINQAADKGILYIPPEATRPVVYMSLQGDMTATLLRFTNDWMDLVPTVKDIIGDGVADVKVGAGLSYNPLDAVEGAVTSAAGLFTSFIGGITGMADSSVPDIQVINIKELLSDKLDFLGLSAFAPLSGANFATSEFMNSATQMATALSKLVPGLDLAQLLGTGKLELHYSEWGLGGGFKPLNGLEQLAASADAAAQQPWTGITGMYNKLIDPWVQGYLSVFRQTFFNKALQWVSSPFLGTASINVQQVFVWSMDSWDVFGIYPTSSSTNGTFRDISIVRKIAAHNMGVIAAQVCKFQTAADCEDFITKHFACLTDFSGIACLGGSAPAATNTPSKPVEEAGPAQTPTSSPKPAPVPAPSTPKPDASPIPAANDTASVNDTGLDMAPDASAASPAPAATVVAPSPSSVGSTGSSKKNSAAGRSVAWALSATLGFALLLIEVGIAA